MAAKKKTDENIVTGLETAKTVKEKKEKEYDLVASLLKAANYRNDEDLITTAEVRRNGKFFFEVNLHPLGDEDVRKLRKKATKYMPHPNNKKLPPIERDFDSSLFNALIIYAATTEEDKKKIWGNKEIMEEFNLVEPHESVDVLLTVGEKNRMSALVLKISGWDEEEYDNSDDEVEEEYVKN